MSRLRTVVFDIGQTLVYYPFPLNWSKNYRPAFESLAKDLNLSITEHEYAHIVSVLTRYNTRIIPRAMEVSSDTIFREILEGTDIPLSYLDKVKKGFYSYFCTEAVLYPESLGVLTELKRRGVITATYSDVAYGMDNDYVINDIKPLLGYIDLPYTTNDIGFRKPSLKGMERLASEMNVDLTQIVFVGDEKKDIDCAKSAGSLGVLINRDGELKEYGQDLEISSLEGVLSLF